MRISGGIFAAIGLSIALGAAGVSAQDLPVPDAAPAESSETPQTAVKALKSYGDFDVQADGSYTYTFEFQLVPQTEQAVKAISQAPMSFREDVSTLEILEAYTLKQDGRRLDVPPDRIKLTSPPYAARAPIFSTVKAKVLIFPDVAVGDRLVAKVRTHMHTPDFPGQFAMTNVLSRATVYEDARLSIRHPNQMPLKVDMRGLTELPAVSEDGFVRRTWTFVNKQAIPEEVGAVDRWDREPRLIASTFADWSALAKAYQERAKPMAAVTPAIQKMADEITAGIATPREQAKALYEWVSLNIRYVGVYLGAGGFVPHSAESVLSNRYGDCKDHVTLLEALLAAKGIASSPVLIHMAPRFETPSVATPAMFNHAITWLPDFDVYLDSTARFLSFGVLPQPAMDKPILLTRDGTMKRTAPLGEKRGIHNKLEMTVAEDGSATGTVVITGFGPAAATFRAQLSNIDTEQVRPRFLQSMLSSAGMVGSAELSKDDPTKLTDTYSYTIRFKATDWLRTDSAGAFVVPSGLFSSGRIAASLTRLSRPVEKVNHACGPMTIEEHTTLHLPKTLKLGKGPSNLKFEDPAVAYSATYTVDGSTINAVRKLTALGMHGSCPPDEMAAYRRMAEQLRKDFRAQVLYDTR